MEGKNNIPIQQKYKNVRPGHSVESLSLFSTTTAPEMQALMDDGSKASYFLYVAQIPPRDVPCLYIMTTLTSLFLFFKSR